MIKPFLVIAILCLFVSGGLYAQAPVVSSFSPVSGPVGTVVTINGSNLSNPTILNIGGVAAVLVSGTDTQLSAMVMPGAVTGGISLTSTNGTAASTGNFRVINTPYPTMQQGNKIVGTGAVGGDQGISVAVSSDGNTAVIGSNQDNSGNGAAFVYTRDNGIWSQQGTKLFGTGGVAAFEGQSVAINADGNTIAIGGTEDNSGQGAIWIFTRSNGAWSQQGAKLTGTGIIGQAGLGASISLSADGNTLISGGNNDNFEQGAVWIFTRTNGIWSQLGNKLVGTGPSSDSGTNQGYAVAMSADGKTIAVGGINDANLSGAVWVYTLTNGVWVQQGSKIPGTSNELLGYSVALSANGGTLLAGAPRDNNSIGSAYVYTLVNNTWAQQGPKLLGTDSVGESGQGKSVNLSADGNIAVIAGPDDNNGQGAIWIFARNNSNWTQQGKKLLGTGNAFPVRQGYATSLSANGNTLILGGPFDLPSGTVWAFSAMPIVKTQAATSITTTTATLNGLVSDNGSSTIVSIQYSTSADLTGAITAPLTSGINPIEDGKGNVSFSSSLTGLTPGITYYYRIAGVNSSGTTQGSILSFSTFALPPVVTSFTPSSGAPGTLITITGTSLANTTAFTVGGKSAVVVSSTATQLVALVMPGAISGNISVTTAAGISNSKDNFSITPIPYPNKQSGNKLVGTGNTGASQQGLSAAISADGNTAIVGAPEDNNSNGAAWIYARINGVWAQQSPKLVANSGQSYYGSAVALSADGNTAIVGGHDDNGFLGAVWIYTRTNGAWTQQGPKLVGTPALGLGVSRQGWSVALSADGNTALVGAYQDHNLSGAAYVFVRNNGVWAQQGTKLLGAGSIGSSSQGSAVALSADGNTAVVGGLSDNSGQGAVWVYTRTGSTWTQQGSKLTCTGNISAANFGSSVAISIDGSTIAVGGDADYNGEGGLWVFTNTNGVWSQQGSKLFGTGSTIASYQGISVSISADGSYITSGGYGDNNNIGAYWTFARNGNIWTQLDSKIFGTDNTGASEQGRSIALSADGNTLISGGNGDNAGVGAAWIFTANPVAVTQPATLITTTTATLNGNVNTNGSNTSVNFEYSTAANLSGSTIISPTNGTNPLLANTGKASFSSQLTGLKSGTKYYFRINGTNANGAGNGTIDNFTTVAGTPSITSFSPANGSVGTLITITGENLDNVTSITVGGKAAIVTSDVNTTLTCLVMPGATGGAIVLTTPGGTSTAGSAFNITNTPYPTIQQGNAITGTGAESAEGSFEGASVAISADGNTAVVGADADGGGKGAIWVYTRVNGIWSQQGQKIVIVHNSTSFYFSTYFGSSVAISADGNTILVGSYGDAAYQGSAWVYTRANGVWSQQGAKLIGTGNIGAAQQGSGVALSADGNVAVVCGNADDGNKGAVWIFTRTDSVWSQQGPKIVIGITGVIENEPVTRQVALSADGNTFVVGNFQDNNSLGSTSVYTQTEGAWAQQGNNLAGTGKIGTPQEGMSVAISADGNTIITGGPGDNNQLGACWIYKRINGIWAQSGNKITSPDAQGDATQGASVSLSADGNTAAVVGTYDNDGFTNPGSVWIYTQKGGNYTQQVKLKSKGGALTGSIGSTSLSADGSTLILGDPEANDFQGQLFFFSTSASPTPLVNSFTPATAVKGTSVVITGTNFTGVTRVTFGGIDAQSFTVNLPTTITAIVGEGDSGNVTVTTQGGSNSLPGFNYVPVPLIVALGPLTFPSGGNVVLAAGPVTGFAYQWMKDGVNISEATKSTYTATQSGSYTVSITLNGISTTSLASVVTAVGLPMPTISANGSSTIISGANVILTVSPGTGYTYQWYKDGVIISGATNATYDATQSGSYAVSITSNGISKTSASIVITVVFDLPPTNFKLTITSATCKGSNNGSVNITAAQNLNYTATITGNGLNTPYPFTTSADINNLAAGTYNVCITVAGQPDYSQCYSVVITEPQDLSVYSTINDADNSVSLSLHGATQYNINLNGVLYTTTDNSITLPLLEGNNSLSITTDRLCQGTVLKLINISGKISPYPVPFQNTLNLNIGNTNISKVLIEIHDVGDGKVVYSKQFDNQSGVLVLDVTDLKDGVYALHLSMDNNEKVFKILKK